VGLNIQLETPLDALHRCLKLRVKSFKFPLCPKMNVNVWREYFREVQGMWQQDNFLHLLLCGWVLYVICWPVGPTVHGYSWNNNLVSIL
jgi:hypothetical protein